MADAPAYKRLQVDQRRALLIDTGSALFAEHAFEEITMREIAQAAGVSKALLYHYFPSKAELFAAAVEEKTRELAQTLELDRDEVSLEQLPRSVESYLRWIERNERWWVKLMQSAATLPQARDAVERFRDAIRERILVQLAVGGDPAALRNALSGWLGYVDAAILDWLAHKDLTIEQVRDMLVASFAASVMAAAQADPRIELALE